jgi:hypothetical protein
VTLYHHLPAASHNFLNASGNGNTGRSKSMSATIGRVFRIVYIVCVISFQAVSVPGLLNHNANGGRGIVFFFLAFGTLNNLGIIQKKQISILLQDLLTSVNPKLPRASLMALSRFPVFHHFSLPVVVKTGRRCLFQSRYIYSPWMGFPK